MTNEIKEEEMTSLPYKAIPMNKEWTKEIEHLSIMVGIAAGNHGWV